MTHHQTRRFLAGIALFTMAACQTVVQESSPPVASEQAPAEAVTTQTLAMYASFQDGDIAVPAIPASLLTEDKARQIVNYWTDHPVGSIIVDPYARRLYHVQAGNKAMRYTVGVGAAGFGFSGEAHTPYQRDWPRWTPTDTMLASNPEFYGPSSDGVPGGLENPMGARALYIHNRNGDTYYRIHGTPDPQSIGTASSSGCIRMFNHDVVHLAERTDSMAKVVVLTQAQSGQGTVPPEAGGASGAIALPSPQAYETEDISAAG